MPKKQVKASKKDPQKKAVLAKQDDGTIQLTLTVPWDQVAQKREEVVSELVRGVEVSGFRKGKAPLEVARKQLSDQEVYNQTLQHILPDLYAQAVEEYKLNPILAPRFELVSANEESTWVIRAITCELPEVVLGDYEKKIKGAVASSNIWTPGKGEKDKKQPGSEEKQHSVIQALIENFQVNIPKPLIDEEVNHKLSRLIDQTQRLGMTVEQYLASTGKNIDQVRQDYEKQATEAIRLELVLSEIAKLEKIEIPEEEVEQVLKVSKASQTQSATPDNGEKAADNAREKAMIRSVLARRRALDRLVSLI